MQHISVAVQTPASIRTRYVPNTGSVPYLRGTDVAWRQFSFRSRSLLQQPINNPKA